MNLSGWGKYPRVNAKVHQPLNQSMLMHTLNLMDSEEMNTIARGFGRSYGDSSLADDIFSMQALDNFIDFDEKTGYLRCQAGISLATILEIFVPKGWFLPVVPGTKFISVGGAVASDVHGKNHHVEGSFCTHIDSLVMVTLSDGIIRCSPTQRSPLFYATCGGMGLTGIILEVCLKLKPIASSYINQVTHKASNLEEVFALFDEHSSTQYSVAWIDCLAKGDSLGRSLLLLGEHSKEGGLELRYLFTRESAT